MAYFAQLNSDNIVTQVLTVADHSIDTATTYLSSMLGGTWLQTTLNLSGNQHYSIVPVTSAGITISYTTNADNFSGYSGLPIQNIDYAVVPVISAGITISYSLSADGLSGLRYNYAEIGYTYDSVRDAFIPPKPIGDWLLNETTCTWISG